MIRTLLTLAAGIGVGVAVTFAADHDHHKAVKVTAWYRSRNRVLPSFDDPSASCTWQTLWIFPANSQWFASQTDGFINVRGDPKPARTVSMRKQRHLLCRKPRFEQS